jgi:hypothetical protein
MPARSENQATSTAMLAVLMFVDVIMITELS